MMKLKNMIIAISIYIIVYNVLNLFFYSYEKVINEVFYQLLNPDYHMILIHLIFDVFFYLQKLKN